MSGGRLADVLPLAPAQEGLLYHALLDGHGPDVYLVQTRFRVDGPVDAAALRGAVAALLARHPNLRACFRHKGLDRAVQLVPHRVTVPWAEADLSGYDPAEAEAELRRLLAADRARRFDVTRPPLLRCTLARRGAEPAELILTLHHILVDGWSMPILARELSALYAGRGAELPPAPPFRAYLSWLRGQDGESATEAWRAALAGIRRPTRVAGTAVPRGAAPPPGNVEFELSPELSTAVRQRARQAGVTVNTLAQAAWALVLARMTGADDVVFGAVVSGRPAELAGVEAMVGMLVNTLPVRVRLRSGERVGELLTRLQGEQLRLLPHHHVRLAEVQRLAGVGELFDTALAFENFPRGEGGSGGLRLVEVRDATHYPLTVTMLAGERLWLRLSHRPDCFGRAEAELIARRLVRALEVLAGDPDAEADRVDVLPALERRRLLVTWNDTARASPGLSVPERFGAQAARTPDAVAVESAGRVLTYRELDARTDGLAGRLAAAGVAPETPVAVLTSRSADLVIAQLAVLKAGGHYVPLDRDQPESRLFWLLRDAGARIVLTDRAPDRLPDGVRALTVDGAPAASAPGGAPAALAPGGAAVVPAPGGAAVALAPGGAAVVPAPDGAAVALAPGGAPAPSAPRVLPHPDSAAYVMYTSGSTGAPKGVVATHRNLVELAADRRFTTGAHARVLLHSPYTFDAATYELWVPLLTGGTVVVAPPGPVEPDTLRRILPDGGITALWLTAELFRTVAHLAPDALAGLREVWAGGDIVAPEAVRRVQAACSDTVIVNGYEIGRASCRERVSCCV